jgi:hypothetical protein
LVVKKNLTAVVVFNLAAAAASANNNRTQTVIKFDNPNLKFAIE